jgi:hypothetical protein
LNSIKTGVGFSKINRNYFISIRNSMEKFIQRIMKWLGTSKTLSIQRSYVGRFLVGYYHNMGLVLLSIHSRSPGTFDLIRQIKEETEMLLSDLDAYQIYTMVKKTLKIDGDTAEVGVYKGGSVKLIREASKKPLHVFDTFEGLPGLSEHDNPEQFHKGDYSASLETVKEKKYARIIQTDTALYI